MLLRHVTKTPRDRDVRPAPSLPFDAGTRRVAVVACAAFVLCTTGCFRYRTHVPGVIDMRTDAADAETARPKPPKTQNNDVLTLVLGAGTTTTGDRLVVEERHFWVAGVVPLFGTDAREELGYLVDTSSAARDLQIGEAMTPIDVAAALVLPQLVPLIGWVLPSFTFHAHATPIRLEPRAPLPPVSVRVDAPVDVLEPAAPQPAPASSDADVRVPVDPSDVAPDELAPISTPPIAPKEDAAATMPDPEREK